MKANGGTILYKSGSSVNQNKNILVPFVVDPTAECTYSVDLTTAISAKLSLKVYNPTGNLTNYTSESPSTPQSLTFTSDDVFSGRVIVDISYTAALTSGLTSLIPYTI